jgi:hypothetical protein
MENIQLAHQNARKGKSHYSEVAMVDENPEFYFEQIHSMLKNKTFKNSKYHIFKRTFGKKEREIFKLPYFPDRIIHHCIMQVLEPIWKKTLIRDTYSSIKGRGLHDGVKRVKKALKDTNATTFCLKMDVKKFYPSVKHFVLKAVVRLKIKCKDTLWLLDEIIDSTKGIPIGNYLSQYFGNLVLSVIDHFVKEICNMKYYFRYCDDIVMLSRSKKKLHRIFKEIKNKYAELKLQVKSNYQIFPVDDRGVDFLGYRFFHNFALLRKSIVLNFKKKIKDIKCNFILMTGSEVVNGLMSYYGWIKHGNCAKLFYKYIDNEIKELVRLTCLQLKQKNPLKEVLA